MKYPVHTLNHLISGTVDDDDLRNRLLEKPRETIEKELGVTLDEGHEIHVHEETCSVTHVTLPPRSKFRAAERQEARTGSQSLEFLHKTLYDPAPPVRPPAPSDAGARISNATPGALADACRESIRRGLDFLESGIDENGAWHCIRFNTADPDIPRHFERPPFISAFCVLALESCDEPKAKAMCAATRAYLADTMEYPGLWRYYRHLPQDLDSSTLCSLVIGNHPWILLERNVPEILANRDENGRFQTWILADDEPDVVSVFRIEADPVVNANVIAYLGDRPEAGEARRWLEGLVIDGKLDGTSKWYPDSISIYYAITRALLRVPSALDRLRPALADGILGLRDGKGEFGNILQTAQAVSALYNIGSLQSIDAEHQVERFLNSQREDGSWPELLAFGDQELKWGMVGQVGHGSESVTSAFCIEALERLVEILLEQTV
ncbi:MAG: hypothetical protein OXE42_01665 [Gammaproteobacteria bacterium]|nr:hypothetical protein [Gammaproteobacteria bacterium]